MAENVPKEADSEAPTAETATSPENAAESAPPAAGTPRTIGRYHIRHLIDSGGMGKVYLAVQEQPRRTVALKVMRQGIASRSALRRFEFESQILARLKHPCIAEVYEAGTHDDGSGGVPYFAMEYIPNAKTIIEYAESRPLTTRERFARNSPGTSAENDQPTPHPGDQFGIHATYPPMSVTSKNFSARETHSLELVSRCSATCSSAEYMHHTGGAVELRDAASQRWRAWS